MNNEKNTQDTRKHVIGKFPIDDSTIHDEILSAREALYAGKCLGSEMTGWLTWPEKYLVSDEYRRIKKTAEMIRDDNDAVIVVGIGGSYLTPQMILHSEYGEFYNEIASRTGLLTRIYFAGCDLSPDRLKEILETATYGDWSIIYISKSGGTMEPALAFRTLWEKLYEDYGAAANSRVYTVTDESKGILKGMANEYGWESFVIPDDIGGRFSGFTAAGLLPLAVAGIDTDALLKGAIDAMNDCRNNPENFAVQYAKWRCGNYLRSGMRRCVEFLATNTPYMSYCAEWLKQLFGESEGKGGTGVFPASGVFPTDLHSLGQYLQDGTRVLIFETFIKKGFKTDVEIPESDLNDNLDSYVGKKFTQAASAAMQGAYNAHTAGGNPCAMIEIDSTLEAMGAFMYYCFVTTSLGAITMGVNPFDQPGVELHKSEMKSSPEWDK